MCEKKICYEMVSGPIRIQGALAQNATACLLCSERNQPFNDYGLMWFAFKKASIWAYACGAA